MDLDQIDRAERKLEFLQKREIERQLNKQYRKDDHEQFDAKNETIHYFEQSFKEKEKEILNLIKDSHVICKDKLPAYFDNISKQILILQKYVASSNLFLRTYDIKIYQKIIQDLNVQLKETETLLLPKKKFGFRKKKIETISLDVIDSKLNGDTHREEIHLDDNFLGFRNENGKLLNLTSHEIFKKDVTLSNLTNCTVHIHGAPSTLHISNVKNCNMYIGPVSTSVFADSCVDCTLRLSCQQLRLHSSIRVDIYLHVTSRAIMEDCNQIQIAPYDYCYEGIEKDYIDSGLDRNINNWQCIDDFNWLNTEKRSPHWKILDTTDPNKKRIHNNH